MRRWLLLLAVVGCRRVPDEALKVAPAARAEQWVDASAPAGGDGSRDRPLKAPALAPGTTVHLATGLYELNGPLPDDLELVGGKAVVLHTEAGLTATRATLRHLAVQGGQTGLQVLGPVTLEDVSFSGQRKVAVRVEPAGALHLTGGRLEGSVPETIGVLSAGQLVLSGATFSGALRRGVRVTSGDASVTDARSEGPAEAVHVSGGRAVVTRTHATGGRAAAFYANGGRLELHDVEVNGHEYAVQVGSQAELEIDGLKSDRAEVGAVASIQSTVRLRRVVVTRAGTHGALELLESQSRVEDLTVSDVLDVAVTVRLGRLDARKVRVRGVRGVGGRGGDGLIVRDATAVLEDVEVRDVGGLGLVATAFSKVDVNGLRCEGCTLGALLVERHASVTARGIVSMGAREAAVSLPDDGVLELEGLEVDGKSPAVWAECAAGARVVLKGKLPARELMSGRCLELVRASPDAGTRAPSPP